MFEFVQKGGLLVWPILLISIIGFGLFLERLTYYHRVTIYVAEFLQGLGNLIRRRNFAEALHECAATPGPVARVVHSAIIHHDRSRSELKEIVQESAQLEVPYLERNLGAMNTLALLAPLLGLLGTILGMIDTFTQIANTSGIVTANQLSFGIYQSLLTSALGLAVAIPAYAAGSYLSSRVKRLLHDIERAGIEIVNLLSQKDYDGEIIDFQRPATEPAQAGKK
jgi:biopolymer transport protein ExbB